MRETARCWMRRGLVCFLALACLAFAAGNGTSAAPESALAAEIRELRALLREQQRQIDELKKALLDRNAGAQPAAAAPVRPQADTAATAAPSPALQLRIGDTYVTPVGFMDLTAVYRDTAPGTNIGTNFGSIPYRTQAAVNGNLSEFRLSPQNSRLGLRLDTVVKGTRVLGYWESDFLGALGNPPLGNVAVSTNGYPLRLRLFWVDLKRDKWEILGGQTWSLITPGRTGISPLPSDVFFSQAIDVNYTAGIPWGRIPEFRFVYRPNKTVTTAIALDNPEQYIGGSSGGGAITLPSGLAGAFGGQLSNGTLTLGTPNQRPDVIGKVAVDGKMPNGNAMHFEVAGMSRAFRTYLPASGRHFTKSGGALSANLNVEVLKGLRLLTMNYYSQGGGRYLFGQAPDLVVQSDGSLSLVEAMGTTSGFEYTRNRTLLYAYYGGVYAGRHVVDDTTGSKPGLAGYGYRGAPDSQNRSVQQVTFGFNQTLWRDSRWGALNFMAQYAYFTRNPWFLATGAPRHAYMNEIWLNLRYTLPGAPPTLQ